MKHLISILLVVSLFTSGCTLYTYNTGVKSVSPAMKGFGKMYTVVDSLTPTFKWEPDAASGCTYDFAIWDMGETLPNGTGTMVTKGPALYYKEGLTKTEHTIEIPLGPDTSYFWSVRTRCNGKVSEWATFDYNMWAVVAAVEGHNWPFFFKTPAK